MQNLSINEYEERTHNTIPTSIVLIHDVECYIAITHKYILEPAGVFKDEYGNYLPSLKDSVDLQSALVEYYEANEFLLPVKGFVSHREQCLDELSYMSHCINEANGEAQSS